MAGGRARRRRRCTGWAPWRSSWRRWPCSACRSPTSAGSSPCSSGRCSSSAGGWCRSSPSALDSTIDPARFVTFAIPRRSLLTGLALAGVIGVPGVVTVGAALSMAGVWWRTPAALVVGLVCSALAVATCVIGARATTSAASTLVTRPTLPRGDGGCRRAAAHRHRAGHRPGDLGHHGHRGPAPPGGRGPVVDPVRRVLGGPRGRRRRAVGSGGGALRDRRRDPRRRGSSSGTGRSRTRWSTPPTRRSRPRVAASAGSTVCPPRRWARSPRGASRTGRGTRGTRSRWPLYQCSPSCCTSSNPGGGDASCSSAPSPPILMGWGISADVAYDGTAFWTHVAAPLRGTRGPAGPRHRRRGDRGARSHAPRGRLRAGRPPAAHRPRAARAVVRGAAHVAGRLQHPVRARRLPRPAAGREPVPDEAGRVDGVGRLASWSAGWPSWRCACPR